MGIFYIQAWTCITNVGEPGGERHVRAAVKATSRIHQTVARIFSGRRKAEPSFPPRPESLALPRLDPRTCETEDVFDWTSRAAAIAIGAP